ncbi:DUF6708 domain-containing protein [Halomonas sp. SpR8]|uniref:DUF6708 domain-containing protein n=1 Tax=Halomonas sp. SpR8 TaxID=3050463 RepID=UPI0027E4FBEE|nr:DUF6708 domain-containing protein [Halomonas sp. SpR8]MDQ7729777.1 hypothetical protein [Halomonas sp. SpR8]
MQSIHRYFANLSQQLGLADELIRLSPKRRAAKQPMQLGEVQDQTEHYLDLSSGSEEGKGIFTGVWGMGAVYLFLLMSPVFFQGRWKEVLGTAVVMCGITLAVFLLEVFWPASSPIRFNRRTREIYFQDRGKLYHTAWDDAVAWMQESRSVTQYTGAMTETPLQILLQRYGHPDDVIALRLNLPIGRTAETQGMMWEYLRCYMENGPWFDEQGNPTASSNRKAILIKHYKKQRTAKIHLRLNQYLVKKGIMSRGRLWATTVFEAFMLPLFFFRDLTSKYARQRAAKQQWHSLVKERCRANGPTMRLYDLEVAGGLHQVVTEATEPTNR